MIFSKLKSENKVLDIPIIRIRPNKTQPRKNFDEDELLSLAQSITANGILQPLTVRKLNETEYELIAGERRLRASFLAGLSTVPCVLIKFSDKESAVFALIENLQRSDLNMFEEARGISRLIRKFDITQEEAALKLGKKQSTIANKLRLLRLTAEEREIIAQYGLTERHARAVLRLGSSEDRLFILRKIAANNLNVEKSETLIDNFIGKRKEEQSYKRRYQVFQNVNIFLNTINKAIQTMQSAGIAAESRRIQGEEYIEYRVRIPMKSV